MEIAQKTWMNKNDIRTIMGPIKGEINILAAKKSVLSSTRPKAAKMLATINRIIKSNERVASDFTSSTILATLRRALTDDMNLVQAESFILNVFL